MHIVICVTSLINLAVLIYGGITDYAKKEIPNLVPLVLLFTGFFTPLLLVRVVIAIALAVILYFASGRPSIELPGGDFKLLCALAFSIGIPAMLTTVILAGVGSVYIALLTNRPLRRNIPLCTYVAPAYALQILLLLPLIFS